MTGVSDAVENLGRVAIIGMAGRFPGAGDVETLWDNLAHGREGISLLSEAELLAGGADPALLRRDDYVRAKGVLADGDRFDAAFFGYSPREAEILDPQHRVLLECAWEALESAGCDPGTFDGRIGVFAGASLNSYLLFNLMANRRAIGSIGSYQALIASDKDFLASRVSYKLGLTGPSITVQTACSTSLTAVHLACQSLLAGECDLALAGGVSVSAPLTGGYLYEQGGILSPDGHCRAFDAEAGGTVSGNGVGLVVLRRLADALAGGDAIDAVIRGTAINNDGAVKAGYTAPSVDGQAEVIAEALAVADVDPATIGYVEAHGTGTVLGDPIEVAALTRAFREHTQDVGFCAVGSAKSSVGHLDAAAGVTALIKATLALKHRSIPPTLHVTRPNPQLLLETSPFFLPTELLPWPRRDVPRRAGVSSFGIGGSNAHVVLEEAPDGAPSGPSRPVQLLSLSARTAPALAAGARRLADHLDRHPELDVGDVSRTLASRRGFEFRGTVVCRDRDGAVSALRRLEASRASGSAAPVAFVFPGQGAQYAGMARDLYAGEPLFAAELDRCAGLFGGHLGEDLRPVVFGSAGDADERLERTAITQPALFAVEYALARLWAGWGVRPRAMAGHSIGEYVAACLAGVFSLPDAVRLVAARGRLMQAMPRGGMLAVFRSESEVAARLGAELCLAAVNSTALSVVSGPVPAIEDLQRRLSAEGVGCRRLRTSHAFHSASMDGAVGPFVEEVRRVRREPPQIPFCSSLTGTWITDEQATSPEYWGAQLRQPVRFAPALGELLTDPELLLVEVGPGRTLAGFARQHAAWDERRTVLGSLPHPKEDGDERRYLLRSLGDLWTAGVPVDRTGLFAGEDRRPVRLPGYPFQRRRYWIEPDAGSPGPAAAPAVATVEDWFSTPGWKRLPPRLAPVAAAGEAVWVVLGAELGLGGALADRLEAAGAPVVRVEAAQELRQDGEHGWSLDPGRRDHYAGLLRAVAGTPARAVRVLHLWSLAAEPADELDRVQLDAARRGGFDSLLALAQGIGDARTSVPVGIDVLCRGIHAVSGEERLQPENATLLGACVVIPQEVQDVTCRSLDVSGIDPLDPAGDRVTAILAAVRRPTEDRALALRGRHWWVRDFDAVRMETGAGTRLRDGGVYLITGGLGGIGLALAEHLARSVEHPVLGLLGRSAFPAEPDWTEWLRTHGDHDATSGRIRRLRGLQDSGAEVVLLRADVTDLDQTARAVGGLRDRFGALNGVVHAAGAASRGLVAGKSTVDVDEVLAAKTAGTLVLARVYRDDPCDFVLLCSSLTAVLGGPGQSDYCAANAFLDAYAQWARQRTGAPVTSVAWDTWRGVGMAAGLAARLAGSGSAGEPTGHPLLQRLVRRTEESRTYATTLSTADSWVVDEHRIQGHGLVPGTTYLELVRAAVAEEAAGRTVELRDVLFTMPVIVPDGQLREIFTTVEAAPGGLRFAVRSQAGTGTGAVWQEHAGGSVAFLDGDAGGPRDLDQVLRDCVVTEVLETEDELTHRLKLDLVQQGGQIEFSFGPRWRCLRRIQAGEHRLLVTLQLDEAFVADLEDYPLHPALLDVAGAAARIRARDVYYLPFTYGSVQISAGLTSTVHCLVELAESGDSGETLTCDIEMLDPDGRVLVRITDFTVKRINDLDALIEQLDRSAEPPAAGGPDEEAAGVLHVLSEGIAEKDGVTAFARLLSAPELPDQLVVCGRDVTALRHLARSVTPALLAGEVEQLAPLAATHPRPDLDTPYVAPRTEVERAVAEIWQEVLGVDRVGVEDDLFALGGHSLAAVQIGTRIQSRFRVQLDLRDFFDSPTVATTVAVLAAGPAATAAGEEGIEVLDRDGPGGLDELTDDEVDAMLQELLVTELTEQGDNG